jgi:hypothetical protein
VYKYEYIRLYIVQFMFQCHSELCSYVPPGGKVREAQSPIANIVISSIIHYISASVLGTAVTDLCTRGSIISTVIFHVLQIDSVLD